jgi:hypothetical protein
MSQRLTIGGFRFLSDDEIAQIDFVKVSDDSDIGYIVECDIEYPAELLELHNDYPLAPEHLTITEDPLSLVCKSINLKLFGTLQCKMKYKLHYRNLKLYVTLGMKVLRVHHVLAFRRSQWLKSYVELNTKVRQQPKNDFEKRLFRTVSQ